MCKSGQKKVDTMKTGHFWEKIFYSVIEDIHIHKIYQYEEIWRHQREKMSKIAPFLSDRTLKYKNMSN